MPVTLIWLVVASRPPGVRNDTADAPACVRPEKVRSWLPPAVVLLVVMTFSLPEARASVPVVSV